MFKMMKRWLSYLVGPPEVYNYSTRGNTDHVVNAVVKMSNDHAEAAKKVPGIAKSLQPGQLTENTDWMFIQEIGKHISARGNDRVHKVVVYRVQRHAPRTKLAEIKCTNSIYSEWIVACSNSMWKTENKIAYDMHGTPFPLGRMTGVECEIRY